MKFNKFAANVHNRFEQLAEHQLYVADVDKETLWQTYLQSFPEGTNPIYKERTEHDCNCCKNFIRDLGNVVAIIDGTVHTIWDVDAEDEYLVVAEALHNLVSSADIKNVYLRHAPHGSKIGAKQSIQSLESGETITWNHFWSDVPAKYMSNNKDTELGHIRSNADVFKRGLTEITSYALATVADIIESGALYKGDEFKQPVNNFIALQNAYNDAPNKDIFIWENVKKPSSRLRNTVIGSLLQDLSEGKELTEAVTSFELKVAPTNYKRPKALITQGMIDQAMKTINELGIEDSLHRRAAVLEDISINNLIFADRSIKPKLKDSVADLLATQVVPKASKNTKSTEISIEDFIANVVPNVSSIEAELANKHVPNLMTLISPTHADAPNILNWSNNSSWAYNGDLKDSDMRANVKRAGGKVDGVLRCSIQWNESGNDGSNDLDLHCKRSNGPKIYFSNMQGILDVDVTRPDNDSRMINGVAVENMIFPSFNELKDGTYEFFVHDFSGDNRRGFTAEIEINGTIHEYSYPKALTADVPIATIVVKDGDIKITKSMDGTTTAAPGKPIWSITTNSYHKVSAMCLSPNFWDDNKVGSKHYFFLLDQCKNPDNIRGLYNEDLKPELIKHRKVFETLGAQLKCPASDSQVSGLGFNSTVRNELNVRADNRPYIIKF